MADEIEMTIEVAPEEPQAQPTNDSAKAKTKQKEPKDEADKELTTLEKIKLQASEDDASATASTRFRDILGGDYLWA
ncbi:MAG: hypothetical protein IJ892_11815, partial [Prevotella sp.]|nr:hypothetical protein [Prevotella sp.]